MAFNGTDSSKISSANYRAAASDRCPRHPSSRAYRSLFSPEILGVRHHFCLPDAARIARHVRREFPRKRGFPVGDGRHHRYSLHVGTGRVCHRTQILGAFRRPCCHHHHLRCTIRVLWSHGQDYSWWVNAVVVLMIAGAVCYEGFNYWRDHVVAAGLAGGSADPAQSVYAQAQWNKPAA